MVEQQIAVVILTWNNVDYTLTCLRSLAMQRTPHTVYVVDNGSTDTTVADVAAQFPSVHVIANPTNLGFAAGNNVGLVAAFADGADAALVLNNDTTLDPDALTHLVATAKAHPEAGFLSPVILFAQPPHRVWFAGARVNRWTGRSRHTQYNAPSASVIPTVREIERATGCAMLVTRACYRQIGGFDTALFMYAEDTEYSLRARAHGFTILLVPQSVVYHHVSVSVGGGRSPNIIYYSTRNGIVVMDRHCPIARPFAAVRRWMIALTIAAYAVLEPSAIPRLRDVLAGYRDARCGRLGPRDMPLS